MTRVGTQTAGTDAKHASPAGSSAAGCATPVLFPKPSEYCDCGAPAFSLLDTSFEGLDGPWQQVAVAEPEFSWVDPDDEEWSGHRSPGIWGGRNGELWLLACSADPSHPIRAEVE